MTRHRWLQALSISVFAWEWMLPCHLSRVHPASQAPGSRSRSHVSGLCVRRDGGETECWNPHFEFGSATGREDFHILPPCRLNAVSIQSNLDDHLTAVHDGSKDMATAPSGWVVMKGSPGQEIARSHSADGGTHWWFFQREVFDFFCSLHDGEITTTRAEARVCKYRIYFARVVVIN